jgi:hypothetical protein
VTGGRVERRLAAVLAADVAGYSRLMGADEVRTARTLREVAGKKAVRQNPSYSVAYRCLASAFAHLGRHAEAREAAARLLELDPAFTISSLIARGGQSNANAKLAIEGLRKAGVPE